VVVCGQRVRVAVSGGLGVGVDQRAAQPGNFVQQPVFDVERDGVSGGEHKRRVKFDLGVGVQLVTDPAQPHPAHP
jgi:hypothetical protein